MSAARTAPRPAATTMERSRAWTGPAILSYGFRPFFFFGAVWAVVAMALWVAILAGRAAPGAMLPADWHAHEFLFGYLGAIVAGFLLTAVPNWTGRLPVVGWGLGALVLAWFAGRVVLWSPGPLGALAVAGVDLVFPLALAGVILREILAGKNWRNLPVLGLLVLLTVANGLFHWEAATGASAAQGYGLRLGLGTGIMMIALIGGRIVPSFTRNWLVKRGATTLPVPPMARFDRAALAVTGLALLLWIALPDAALTGVALLAVGAVQAVRLWRWRGVDTGVEPLVAVLHAGYAFVPLGALAIGAAILLPDTGATAAAQHLWMAGAIGLMTLAVMTRATLGHTGQALAAGAGTTAIYLALVAAVVLRLAGAAVPDAALTLYALAGLCWAGAFGGFAVIYGRLLLRAKG
ncbi:NnrS family protein [Jannaschia rubra]|uniref:NnrS protein n=1 Tax=Jannaschia rubra TaxID=282197 RepID=A0A0M6XUE5_9RHOB|nr:NnrS family protein [Jannaschia rubra]CTQ34766.1 NnrS protein [Jannaschia rubra]SFG70243.1 uncharacterized protein involved in response to NO [Jannaschia rubra]